MTSAPFITVTSGIRGWFAVLIGRDGIPDVVGISSFETAEGAASEGREWARAEGLQFREPAHADR